MKSEKDNNSLQITQTPEASLSHAKAQFNNA